MQQESSHHWAVSSVTVLTLGRWEGGPSAFLMLPSMWRNLTNVTLLTSPCPSFIPPQGDKRFDLMHESKRNQIGINQLLSLLILFLREGGSALLVPMQVSLSNSEDQYQETHLFTHVSYILLYQLCQKSVCSPCVLLFVLLFVGS